MKTIVAAGALFAAAVGMQAEALAQSAPTYRYCLQESGFGRSGGSGQLLCRYNTLAQCWASKSSPSDFCYPNPAYFQRK